MKQTETPNTTCTRSPGEHRGYSGGTAVRRDSVRTPYGQSGVLRGLKSVPSKWCYLVPPRWSFYLIWIILTSLCIPIAFFLNFALLKIIIEFVGDFIYVNGVRHITEDYLFLYTFVPMVGFLIGILQYGLLRYYLPRMGLWVLATTAGWLLGVFLIVLSGWLKFIDETFNLDLAFLLMGLAIGTGQWLLLRQRLPQAGWWIGANVMGWGLLALITAENTVDQFQLIAIGLLPACVTAAVLALLMNQVQPTQPCGM